MPARQVDALSCQRDDREAQRVVGIVVARRQLGQEGWHRSDQATGRRGAEGSHPLPEPLGVETLAQHCRAAGRQRPGDRAHAADVEHWQVDQDTVAFVHVTVLHTGRRVDLQVGAHHSLGRSRRARGEDHHLRVPTLDERVRRTIVGCIQRLDTENPARPCEIGRPLPDDDERLELCGWHFLQPVQEARMHDHAARPRLLDRVRQHAATVGDVERRVARAREVDAEPGAHPVGSVRQPGKDYVAGSNTQPAQARRGAARERVRVPIAPARCVLEQQEVARRRRRGSRREQRGKHAIFPAWHCRIEPWRVRSSVDCHVPPPLAAQGDARPDAALPVTRRADRCGSTSCGRSSSRHWLQTTAPSAGLPQVRCTS
jgi:hypothetical protein